MWSILNYSVNGACQTDYDTCTCKISTPKQTWQLHTLVVDVAEKHMSYCVHTVQATELKIGVTIIMGRYHGGTILPSPLGLIIYFGTFGRKVMVMLRYIIDPEMTIGVTICNIHICFEKRNKSQKHQNKLKGNVWYGSWITVILKSFNRRVTRIQNYTHLQNERVFGRILRTFFQNVTSCHWSVDDYKRDNI